MSEMKTTVVLKTGIVGLETLHQSPQTAIHAWYERAWARKRGWAHMRK